MNSYPKRLIEVDLPIKQISAHARREKSIRHGHISTLHIWWARRPLAACRAVICAALWPDPVDELCPQRFRDEAANIINNFATKAATDKELSKHCSTVNWNKWQVLAKPENRLDGTNSNHLNILRYRLLDFIADFANWDNSTQPDYLETSRLLTQIAHESLGGIPGTKPLVVDPFAGGGAIPLEALRVGADAFASDLNPVAVLLNKVVLEYIPKYGQTLADEVRKWGEWVKKEAEKELAEFYPKDADGSTPIAYLWARTITCEGPVCGAEVPLIRSFWLSKKQSIALKMQAENNSKKINFYVINKAKGQQEGTVKRGSVTCPCCGYTTSRQRVEVQMNDGVHKYRLLAVVAIPQNGRKQYRLPTQDDLQCLQDVKEKLKQQVLNNYIPYEDIPYLRSIFNVYVYGIKKWSNLFNERQRLAMATLVRIVDTLPDAMNGMESGLIEATCTCLGLAVDRIADYNSNIVRWASHRENAAATFGRQALGMVWDYCETVPISESTGSFSGSLELILQVCKLTTFAKLPIGSVQQATASSHPLPDDIASLIFTDPPYYDAVPYANLSDFFYMWLKRSIGKVHSDLLDKNETPKEGEAVQLAERNPKYSYKTRKYFEELMAASFSEGKRYTQSEGLGIIVFAHKATDAWETLLSAVVDAGWTITGSWPIDTEMGNRLRAMNSAALASSVHLVCRPRNTEEIGDWRDVLQELPQRIHEWMPRLASEGVVGADAIFACLGPALEIFSRYSSVEKASGEIVTLREYLEQVWAAVSKEALGMIFSDADATGFEEDARLTAMWLWTLSADATNSEPSDADNSEDDDEDSPKKSTQISGYILEFDAARKIAQGLGAHLENLDRLVEIKGQKARLLPVAERSAYLLGKDAGKAPTSKRKSKSQPQQLSLFPTLETEEEAAEWGKTAVETPGKTVLDRIHQTMILFAAGRSEAMKRFLVDEGIGNDQRFWTLAQALSALYPSSSEEKRWVDGVLARKKNLGF
jgi:adenine-specific DNA methylase